MLILHVPARQAARGYNRAMTTSSAHFELHLPVTHAQCNAVDLLSGHCDLSRQTIKQAMQNGALWLEHGRHVQRLRRAKKTLSAGDELHFYYDEAIQNQQVPPAELVADEKAYSIWNKPCGMYSQGSRWGDHCTIYRYAEQHLLPERPAFIVHRLDRAASGLMILAHSKKMAAAFSSLFVKREIGKQYEAVVAADLSALALPFEISKPVDGKPALSRIIGVEPEDGNSRLRLEIETGRKHQIRRHLAESGWPIVGDRLYGTKSNKADNDNPANTGPDLQLKSVYLKFTCPVTGQIKEYSL